MVFTRDKKVLDFIKHVKSECKKHKIKFRMSKYNTVHCGDYVKCGGFFNDYYKTLAISTGKRTQEQWLALLVHEYNHLIQWVNKSKYWCSDMNGFLDWLEGKYSKWDAKTLNKKYRMSLAVEWDCESQSLKMIKSLGLPLNKKEYTRQANSYLASYAIMKQKRKWMKKSPYRFPSINKLMPSDRILTLEELDNPSKEYTNLVLKYCY